MLGKKSSVEKHEDVIKEFRELVYYPLLAFENNPNEKVEKVKKTKAKVVEQKAKTRWMQVGSDVFGERNRLREAGQTTEENDAQIAIRLLENPRQKHLFKSPLLLELTELAAQHSSLQGPIDDFKKAANAIKVTREVVILIRGQLVYLQDARRNDHKQLKKDYSAASKALRAQLPLLLLQFVIARDSLINAIGSIGSYRAQCAELPVDNTLSLIEKLSAKTEDEARIRIEGAVSKSETSELIKSLEERNKAFWEVIAPAFAISTPFFVAHNDTAAIQIMLQVAPSAAASTSTTTTTSTTSSADSNASTPKKYPRPPAPLMSPPSARRAAASQQQPNGDQSQRPPVPAVKRISPPLTTATVASEPEQHPFNEFARLLLVQILSPIRSITDHGSDSIEATLGEFATQNTLPTEDNIVFLKAIIGAILSSELSEKVDASYSSLIGNVQKHLENLCEKIPTQKDISAEEISKLNASIESILDSAHQVITAIGEKQPSTEISLKFAITRPAVAPRKAASTSSVTATTEAGAPPAVPPRNPVVSRGAAHAGMYSGSAPRAVSESNASTTQPKPRALPPTPGGRGRGGNGGGNE